MTKRDWLVATTGWIIGFAMGMFGTLIVLHIVQGGFRP